MLWANGFLRAKLFFDTVMLSKENRRGRGQRENTITARWASTRNKKHTQIMRESTKKSLTHWQMIIQQVGKEFSSLNTKDWSWTTHRWTPLEQGRQKKSRKIEQKTRSKTVINTLENRTTNMTHETPKSPTQKHMSVTSSETCRVISCGARTRSIPGACVGPAGDEQTYWT